jgi:hypothetical protein
LRAVADDRDLLALDEGEVGVFVVENFHMHNILKESAATQICTDLRAAERENKPQRARGCIAA